MRSQEVVVVGGWGSIYLILCCHHQKDPCIKMGSGVNQFDVSFTVEEHSYNQVVSMNHIF